MILIIRIKGLVEVPEKINEALSRLRLRRKYSAVLVKPTEETLKLLQILRNYIAYGEISKEDMILLLEKRGKLIKGKKVDAKTAVEHLDKKSLEDIGFKPFFRLHPPRGGIDSRLHIGVKRGVLGNHKDKINELMRKML